MRFPTRSHGLVLTDHADMLTCRDAGSISQTLTYPFDVLRRKMQVTGMGALGYQYNGALDALQSIVRTEGVRGLYRGLWPNLRACSPVPLTCTGH